LGAERRAQQGGGCGGCDEARGAQTDRRTLHCARGPTPPAAAIDDDDRDVLPGDDTSYGVFRYFRLPDRNFVIDAKRALWFVDLPPSLLERESRLLGDCWCCCDVCVERGTRFTERRSASMSPSSS